MCVCVSVCVWTFVCALTAPGGPLSAMPTMAQSVPHTPWPHTAVTNRGLGRGGGWLLGERSLLCDWMTSNLVYKRDASISWLRAHTLSFPVASAMTEHFSRDIPIF